MSNSLHNSSQETHQGLILFLLVFVWFVCTDLTLDDLHLEPLENIGGMDEMASSMSLLAVDPPTYDEAIRLAAECLSSSCSESTGLTSPGGSHPSLSQSPPKGNLEHFSPNPPATASPYPSPGHPGISPGMSPGMSPGGLPTPEPSPIGSRNPSMNISWVGQMKVSSQPQQPCPPQQTLPPYPTNPSPQPPMQVPSKSAQISATIKKMEKIDMYGPSCVTGQSPKPMTSPRGIQQNAAVNWQQQQQQHYHQQQQQQPMQQRNMQPQGYDWKAAQQMHNVTQNFHGERTATVVGPENPVYATNMQGRSCWDTVAVPPLFEDTLPTLEYEGGVGYMKAGQNIGGHLQHHGMDPSILSPPYQEDFNSGFGFQGNPLPAMNHEPTTTLGHW